MTEKQLIEAKEKQCPVMAMTVFNGEIEYTRVLCIERRAGAKPGSYEVFAGLESKKLPIISPCFYPAEMIRLKEQNENV